MMHVLDLFSGIGGFSLGLERAGMQTVAFCEIDPYCRRVLAKHWPDVPIYGDVRELTAEKLAADAERHGWGQGWARRSDSSSAGQQFAERPLPIDVICGGFPCQDISVAGKGAGIEGERSGLWSEYARIIGEVRPRYVIVENVAALLGRGLERVLGDLAALGFDAEWHCIPASAVGAPHRRDRLWIVAYPARDVCAEQAASGTERQRARASGQPVVMADAAGDRRDEGREDTDRIRFETCCDGVGQSVGAGATVADANGAGRQQQWRCLPIREELAAAQCGGEAPDAHGQPTQRLTIAWGECGHWLIEPNVGRVAHGVPARVDRLRGLGNAVVPQIPEIIGRAIMRADAAASYDGAHGQEDFARSFHACLAAVRERKAAGGEGWEPK